MLAFPVIQVAGLAGDEVRGGIAIHLGVDVAVLEVGIRVALDAAVVVGGGHIVHAGARLQHCRERVLDLTDAGRQRADLFVGAVEDDDAVHVGQVGDFADENACVPACAIIGERPLQGEPFGGRLELELSVGVRRKVDRQRIGLAGIKRSAILGHVEGHRVRAGRRERVGQVGDLNDAILIQLVVGRLVFCAGVLVARGAGFRLDTGDRVWSDGSRGVLCRGNGRAHGDSKYGSCQEQEQPNPGNHNVVRPHSVPLDVDCGMDASRGFLLDFFLRAAARLPVAALSALGKPAGLTRNRLLGMGVRDDGCGMMGAGNVNSGMGSHPACFPLLDATNWRSQVPVCPVTPTGRACIGMLCKEWGRRSACFDAHRERRQSDNALHHITTTIFGLAH